MQRQLPIHTINHLLPSRANFEGFFLISDAGFVGFTGRFGAEGAGVSRTTLLARREGFLWVISDLSTFLNPFVTASPRFNSANTAAAPPAEGAEEGATMAGGGGGGGGGGPADVDVVAGLGFVVRYELNATPYTQANVKHGSIRPLDE